MATITTAQDQTEKEIALANRLDTMFFNAVTKKRKYYDEWRRNYLLLNNKMWSEWRTANWMPSPTSSEIYPIVSALIAWMMDQSIVFSASASADPHTLYADWLNKLSNDIEAILQSNWLNYAMDDEVYLSCWDGALCGCGILKTVWDPGELSGLGDATIRRIDPWMFYPDPNATSLRDAQFFVETMRLTFDEIERRFPLAYDKLVQHESMLAIGASESFDSRPTLYDQDQFPKTNPGALPSSGTTGSLGPTGSPGSFGLPGQGRRRQALNEGVVVKEFWIKQNKTEDIADSPTKKKPNPNYEYPDVIVSDEWRVVVTANGVILMDELAEDLWSSGRHPYTRFCFDDIGEFWGISLISHLAPAQIAINRLLSSLQHNAELIGNPIFLESDDSGIARTAIVNRPGQRLRLKGGPNAGQNDPHWLQPPNMPQYIQQLIEFWINRMENISGLSAASKGASPPPRTPSSSVTATQESGFVRVRQAMRNLESCLRESGNLQTELITENYTTPRVCSIVGPDGEQTSLQLASKHFYDPTDEGSLPFRFSIFIDAGANNPTSRQSRIAESDTLFSMQAIDRKALLQAHNYPHANEIDTRMEQKEQQAAAAQAASKSRVKSGRTT